MKELPANLPLEWVTQHTQTILNSYKKWTGQNLLGSELLRLPLRKRNRQNSSTASALEIAKKVFWAPFAVLSSSNAPDPVLTYGNQKTLDLWEMPWEVLTQTPGRKTAEPMYQEERQKFLNTVKKNGFIDDYSGIRISASGKRFKIEKATVWNLVDEKEIYIGQAATFSQWKYL